MWNQKECGNSCSYGDGPALEKIESSSDGCQFLRIVKQKAKVRCDVLSVSCEKRVLKVTVGT